MSELKPCPFCGNTNIKTPYGEEGWTCMKCGSNGYWNWNTRPIEDTLRAEIERIQDELDCTRLTASSLQEVCDGQTAEIDRLTAELAEWNDKAVFIQFKNEDELPSDIQDDVYSAMFNCSHVDCVRLFPYIEENGQKYFLVMLREDE